MPERLDCALETIRAGRMVVVVDEDGKGGVTMAAQLITPDAVNFMAKEARGLICVALTGERCQRLRLGPMAAKNESPFDVAFTVSVEARDGVTTGISAADRARTIQVAVDPASTADDLVRPGHIFPLKARDGGVLERAGQTEAAVDVARLAGLTPAGVICEVLNDDGSVARFADLVGFCARHDLGLVTIADLIGYRRQHDRLVERVVDTALPTDFGDFVAIGYRSLVDDNHHVALVKGDVAGKGDVLVGVHTGCVAGDVFRSRGCDCGERLQATLTEIERAGQGVLVYLTQGEPRGVLHDELRPCDDAIAAQIVADLGVSTDSWGRRTQELVHGHS